MFSMLPRRLLSVKTFNVMVTLFHFLACGQSLQTCFVSWSICPLLVCFSVSRQSFFSGWPSSICVGLFIIIQIRLWLYPSIFMCCQLICHPHLWLTFPRHIKKTNLELSSCDADCFTPPQLLTLIVMNRLVEKLHGIALYCNLMPGL